MRNDPGQTVNVAEKHPDVLKILSDSYTGWWNRMYTGFRQWTRIPVGGAGPNPVELTCFDWHGEIIPSNQEMISKDLAGNGVWSLSAESAGVYEVVLRQRPDYVPYKLKADRARLWVNGRELPPQDVAAGASSATFSTRLARGNVNLGTEFIDGTRRRGAYYVDVRFART